MVIGQKKFIGNDNNLEKRLIEIIGEKSKIHSFENILKNFQEEKHYSLSDNGLGKKTYTIYSSDLKKNVSEILKDSIRISNIKNEEFVIRINRGSDEEMEDFNFDKKDQKNQITYLSDKELIDNASQIKDLTEEESQKLKNEGAEFVISSQKGKLKKEEENDRKKRDFGSTNQKNYHQANHKEIKLPIKEENDKSLGIMVLTGSVLVLLIFGMFIVIKNLQKNNFKKQ